LIGRVAITDLSPTIYFGGEFVPVKAIANEEILVSATVAGEGHDYPQVQVVTRDSNGKELSRATAIERNPGTDRYEALIALPKLGRLTLEIEA
jgi:starch synthase (maltosyl-transferring)